MNNNFKLLVALLLLSSWALAQRGAQADSMPSPGPDATTACEFSFSSGSGANFTKFCVTENGNIAQLSVAGNEMIAVGQIGEGYGICDNSTNVAYFDYAYADSGNWQSSTASGSGNVVTVTRGTSDGLWLLKQTITNVPATASSPGSVKVAMALENLSSSSRSVSIVRFADVDADGQNSTNNFDYTQQTALALDPEGLFGGHGLSLTNLTFNSSIPLQTAFTLNTFNGPSPCNAGANVSSQPFVGDGSSVMFWEYTAGAHKTTTLTSTYKPI